MRGKRTDMVLPFVRAGPSHKPRKTHRKANETQARHKHGKTKKSGGNS